MKNPPAWLTEWKRNRAAYAAASPSVRRIMERRALYFAAHTIHTPWRESYYRLATGADPALPVAHKFFTSRENLTPDEWPAFNPKSDAKSQFARALLGFDDAACFDVHMLTYYPKVKARVKERGQWHGATQWQWYVWLHKLYPGLYPHTRGTVLREHVFVLRWVRTGEALPVNKQENLAGVSEAGARHRNGQYGEIR